MTDTASFTTTIAHELRMRRLTVETVERPTPRLVRITLGGPDMVGFRSDGSGDHVKVFFPAPGTSHAELPALGERGLKNTQRAARPRGRDYTPKHDRLDEDKLLLDIVLHSEGIGSDWAKRAKIGDTLGVAGPRGSHVLRPDLDELVLFGDETAIPAIANFIAAADTTQHVRAFVEVADVRDVQQLQTTSTQSITWLTRDGTQPGHSNALVDAAGTIAPTTRRAFYWIAAEASVATAVRHELSAQGIEPSAIESRGYWKLDTQDHQEPHED